MCVKLPCEWVGVLRVGKDNFVNLISTNVNMRVKNRSIAPSLKICIFIAMKKIFQMHAILLQKVKFNRIYIHHSLNYLVKSLKNHNISILDRVKVNAALEKSL